MRETVRFRDDSKEERRSLGLMLLLGEEFARETGKEIAKWLIYPPPPEIEILYPPGPPRVPRDRVPRVPAVPAVRDVVSRIFDNRDQTVSKTFDLLKVEGLGRLREITISSPSIDFSLLLEVDDKVLIDRSYSELAEISPHSQIVDAFSDSESGLYILHIGEVKWVRKALATIYVTEGLGPITFDALWVAWEETP